jgi:hypothetical protein
MIIAPQLRPAHDPEKWEPVFGQDHAPIRSRSPMTMRTRKLFGAFGLLALVIVWALLAMALAQSALTDINGFVAAIYYVFAGLGWVLPAMPLISWMSKPDRA